MGREQDAGSGNRPCVVQSQMGCVQDYREALQSKPATVSSNCARANVCIASHDVSKVKRADQLAKQLLLGKTWTGRLSSSVCPVCHGLC